MTLASDNQCHPLTRRIKGELHAQLVGFVLACVHVVDGDCLGRSVLEHESHLAGSSNESQLIWGRCLVIWLLAFLCLNDDRVANGEKSEEVVDAFTVN